jgi:serralysin
LIGGLGNDSLMGGSGLDQFIFNAALGSGNVVVISDYSSADDTILLDDAIFAAIGPAGTDLAAAAFAIGSAATSSAHRIIYNSGTGQLFYDADGSGAGAAVHWATLTGAPLGIANTEFLIV